jgi:hypothetical protein
MIVLKQDQRTVRLTLPNVTLTATAANEHRHACSCNSTRIYTETFQQKASYIYERP